MAGFDRLDADFLERVGEVDHLRRAVKFAAADQAARPGEDRRDRVGRGRLAGLMVAEMAGDGAMRRFGLEGFAIRRQQYRRHQAQRAVALRNRVRLHIAVVVLAGPQVTPAPLEVGGDHVVDQAVFIGQPGGLVLAGELGIEDFLEQVLEAPIVGLQNRVLGREIDRILARQAVDEGGAGKTGDRLIGVVHRQRDARPLRLVDFLLDGRAAVGRHEGELERALARIAEFAGAVLVAEGMAGDDHRLVPVRNQARHVAADDRFAEDGAVENVADGAVGAAQHFGRTEFLDSAFVVGDRRALDRNAMLPGGIGRIDRDLVAGRVAVLDAEVVVLEVDVQVGVDQLFLDPGPDDAGHFVAVHFDDRVPDFDLDHGLASLLGNAGTGSVRRSAPVRRAGQSSAMIRQPADWRASTSIFGVPDSR